MERIQKMKKTSLNSFKISIFTIEQKITHFDDKNEKKN